MELKVVFMGGLLITILISIANPSLATKTDEPWIDPNADLYTLFTESPTSSEYNNNVLKKLSSQHFSYVVSCGNKRGRQCRREVMREILQNKNVSKHCCENIVRVGKDCHVAIANLMFKNYHIKRFASKSLFKAIKVWNRCYAQIEAPTPNSG